MARVTVVGCIIRNSDGDIAILYHRKHHNYCMPTGTVEIYEEVEDALKREMKEELDIDIFTYQFFTKFIHEGILFYIYEILDWEGIVKNMEPNEHTSVKFLTIGRIKYLIRICRCAFILKKTINLLDGVYDG